MSLSRGGPVAALLAALAACSPSLDWREAHLEGSGVAMLFPCRVDRHERDVRMGGVVLRMQMRSCRAADVSFSLTYVDAPSAAQVDPLMREWRERVESNLGGSGAARPFAVPGATPNERSALWRVDGRLPDGRRVVEHAAFFVKGLRLYQAAAIGEALPADAVETFFGAIKVTP